VSAVRLAGVVGLLVLLVILGILIFLYQRNPKAWEVAAGAPAEA